MNTEHLPVMVLDRREAREQGLHVIPDCYAEECEANFATLAKRVAKRMPEATTPTLEFVGKGTMSHSYEIETSEGKRYRTIQIPCLYARITGTAPKLAGWTLAARLVNLDTGERLIKNVPGIELPERFRDTGTECEHCNVQRKRNDVFAVQNVESGEWKQIGRTCIRDFLGHDPNRLLREFVACAKLDSDMDSMFGGFWQRPIHETLAVLETTAACIRIDSWVSRKSAGESGYLSTSDTVAKVHGFRPDSKLVSRYDPNDADKAIARETLAWVRDVLSLKDGRSDYEHNLVVSLKHDALDGRTFGIVASSVQAYLREMSRNAELNQRRAANLKSEYMGQVKERIRDLPATVEHMQNIESDFGTCTLVKLRTGTGNLLSWFCSGYMESGIRPGTAVMLTGTVKGHREYKGVKETQLSRCKLVPAKVDAYTAATVEHCRNG